jgi:hypothetical protein
MPPICAEAVAAPPKITAAHIVHIHNFAECLEIRIA